MKNLFLFLLLSLSSMSSAQIIFLEDFAVNPYLNLTALTSFTQNTSGNCSNDTYEVSNVFDANCGWGASWPANSTIVNGALIINNGGLQTTGNPITSRIVYQRTFVPTCTINPTLSLAATKRVMGGAPDGNFTVFLNGAQVAQFSLTNMGLTWQSIGPIALSNNLLSGFNTISIEQDAMDASLNVDYAFDDITLEAECCTGSVAITQICNLNPCENPSVPIPLYLLDANGNIMLDANYSAVWSTGATGVNAFAYLSDMPLSVTVTELATNCVYTDIIDIDCCTDSMYIVSQFDNPCNHPDEELILDVLNEQGNQIFTGNYSFVWSNGQTSSSIQVGANQLPISVQVTDLVTGCVYNHTYTACCERFSFFYEIENPCENPDEMFELWVLDQNGNPTAGGNYQFAWSNGDASPSTWVSINTLPISVVIYNSETGCEYTLTFENPCCPNSATIYWADGHPCGPWGGSAGVNDMNGNQMTLADYTFAWSTGDVNEVTANSTTWPSNQNPLSVIATDNITGCQYYAEIYYTCTNNFNRPVVENVEVSASPNPTRNQVNITFTDNRKVAELKAGLQQVVILNALGTEVYRGQISSNREKVIDISNLTPGLYLYNVIENNQVIASDKFVKIE